MSIIDDVKEIADLIDKSKNLELYTKILDLEVNIYELSREKRSVDERNEELEKLLKFKDQLVFKDPVYYVENDNTPYCPKCWESESRAIHLTIDKDSDRGYGICQQCKSRYYTKPRKNSPYNSYRVADDDDSYY
jgi:hypothetical protein